MESFLILVITYLISSVPSGLVIAKIFYSIDIREHESKNIGFTNVLRVCGKVAGFTTLFLDIFKSITILVYAKYGLEYNTTMLYWIMLVSFLGHVFSIFLLFRGGKGTASILAMLPICDPILGTIFGVILILGTLITKIVSLSCLIGCFAIMICLLYGNLIDNQLLISNSYTITSQLILMFMITIITFKHFQNIIRLYKGNENKISLFSK